jgi:hypothetical protein
MSLQHRPIGKLVSSLTNAALDGAASVLEVVPVETGLACGCLFAGGAAEGEAEVDLVSVLLREPFELRGLGGLQRVQMCGLVGGGVGSEVVVGGLGAMGR